MNDSSAVRLKEFSEGSTTPIRYASPKLGEAFVFGGKMETRIAVIGIIVENPLAVDKLNDILHDYASIIIGRMGLPYRERSINIISIAVDAPQDVISALSGKIGNLDGVSAKAAFSNVKTNV